VRIYLSKTASSGFLTERFQRIACTFTLGSARVLRGSAYTSRQTRKTPTQKCLHFSELLVYLTDNHTAKLIQKVAMSLFFVLLDSLQK
jgi:hypothetical protein